DELVGAFRFSDAVLRYLVIKRDEAVTEPSLMAKAREEEEAREAQAATRSAPPRERPRPNAGDAPAADADGDDDGPPEGGGRRDWDDKN
ncbi:MAG TPA: 30S ribosomal protein S6, partial [Gammaproteobacteria bacterium]|nr:30S ribosomal protein S6 [Gammaproteobacteria bacterium]